MPELLAQPDRAALSGGDVATLLREPSGDTRCRVVKKIASEFRAATLGAHERAIAVQIFRLLLDDAETMVRRAMAEALCQTELLPHDIALALARDLSEVAAPILEYSEVLTDDDLIEIVQSPVGARLIENGAKSNLLLIARDPVEGTAKQIAIAKRAKLSWRLCNALVESGDEEVVVTLIGNDGADIKGFVAQRVIDRFGASPRVQTALIDRGSLPVTVMERLAFLVSEALRERLRLDAGLPEDLTERVARLAREKALLAYLQTHREVTQIAKLVRRLWERKRLTPSLIFRAICVGEREFFERALANRANIAARTAANLLRGGREKPVFELFRAAGMPDILFRPFLAAVRVAAALDREGATLDRDAYLSEMVNRLVEYSDDELFEQCGRNLTARDLEFVLAKILLPGGPV